MRARTTATTVFICTRMVLTVSSLRPQKLLIKQVLSIFSLFHIRHQFSIASSREPPLSPSSSLSSIKNESKTQLELASIDPSGIAKSVFLECSHLWEEEGEASAKLSLKDLLLELSTVIPETIRKFWRVAGLKPEDVLQILLGFGLEYKKSETESRKVESLWAIFNWASDQGGDFKHLPRSYELMAAALVRVGMFRDIEFLLSTMDCEGISLDSNEILSNLIEGYVKAGELQKAISIYDRMRGQGLVPSLSSYCLALEALIKKNETHLAFGVYNDMVENGLGLSKPETTIFENLIQLLCRNGKVWEARNLVRKVIMCGTKPSNRAFDAIASAYCKKKDYDDLLKFSAETGCAPDVVVSNKVIFSLCRDYSVDIAKSFLEELENVGFSPDEITFGILIGWSCREGKLKNACIYLSELLSRSLKPDVRSYNALISGVLKEGLWRHARVILDEMHEKEITTELATFRVLLAGYCKAREFDQVKLLVGEMVEQGLIKLSSRENPLSKAFLLLGLDPLAVKVRRNNDMGLSKTEFYDNLGNGLYLETDLIKYEKATTGVLEEYLVPDFNSLIVKDCGEGNFRIAVLKVEEMARWGQELSLTAFSMLVNGLVASNCSMKKISNLLEKMPELTDQLDQETLNLLVQALSRKRFSNNARIIFDCMIGRCLEIKNETYTALMSCLCWKRNLNGLLKYWELSRIHNWSFELKDHKALMGFLCQQGLLKEALELFENMLVEYRHTRLCTCHDFLEKLCSTGFTSTAHALVDGLQENGFVFDHIAYSHLIKGFFKEKIISKAFSVLDIMLDKNLVPTLDIIALSIFQLSRARKFEKAVALKEIALQEQSPIGISVCCALITGFCKSGNVWEAANIVQRILSRGLLPDDETCNALLQGYCRINNLMKVNELLCIMTRKNFSISISSYRMLVRLMCTSGMVPYALSVKKLMLKQSNPPDIVIYNILIFSLFQTRNSLFVEALLDELQEKGLQLDGITYNFLVYGYSRCKDVSRSLHYLTAMMSMEHRPSNRSVRTVTCCLCGEGKLGKALNLSRDMEARGWVHDSITQNAIVEGLLDQCKLQEAVSFLDRMVEKGLIPDNINYDTLIKRFCGYGREDKAIDLMNIMLKKANIPSSSSYDCLIRGSCKCDKLDQALDFLSEMLNRSLKSSIKTWDTLIRSLCQDGRTTEAERLLKVMVQAGETPTREMYCYVINRYYCEGNLSKASEALRTMQQSGYEPDFETHWSLISNLSSSHEKKSNTGTRSFLSRLLSESGFSQNKDPRGKLR